MNFKRLLACWLFLALPVVSMPAFALQPSPEREASADDTARFLAGMSVPGGSPLAPLAANASWKYHAAYFNNTFKIVDDRQLSKIRAWSKGNLTVEEPTLFYFFSGPDFLYANAFYPDAKTYVLAGLEPVGAVPDLAKVPLVSIPGVLRTLEQSTRTLLHVSFFRTIDMQTDLRTSPVNGTLPVIYTFMVRSGKVIKDTTLVQLNEAGDVEPVTPTTKKTPVQGAKITFSAPGGAEQTLYYFSANVANGSFKKGGLYAFCDKLGTGNALVKSASYLMHDGAFSEIRSFLLDKSATILQDDTGVPVSQFASKWDLHAYGRYLGPIPLFGGRFQPKLAQLFRAQRPTQLPFGIGYRYVPNESNLMLAVKESATAGPSGAPSDVTGSTPAPAPAAKTAPAAVPDAILPNGPEPFSAPNPDDPGAK